MSTSVFSIVAVWTILLLASTVSADWPLFRGNGSADGHAAKTVVLPEKLASLWEHRLEKGYFQASPIIVGDTIYIGSSEDGLWAFGLNDGSVRWKYPLEYGVLAPAAYHKEPSGYETVVVGDTEGVLHAVDAKTGEFRWKFTTKGSMDGGPNINTHTDRVLVASQDGTLSALQISDGKLVWQYKADDQIRCFPAITDRSAGARRCFVAGCDSHLHIIDLDNGKAVAKVDIEAPTGSTPCVSGSRVFFGTEGNEFLAVDWKQAELVWRHRGTQAFRAPAACADEFVIFGGMDRTVRALDAATGKERWTFRTKGRMENSGPTVVGTKIYVPCSDSFLYVLDLKTGRMLQEIELPGKLTACAAVVSGRLVLGTDDGVLCCLGEKK